MEEQERKQNNKNMGKSIGVAGGAAFFILICAITLTGIGRCSAQRKKEAEPDYAYKKNAEDFLNSLSYIANLEYEEYLGISDAYNYVYLISSFNCNASSFEYVACAKKGNLNQSVLTIKLGFSFSTPQECYERIILNSKNPSYFALSSKIYDLVDNSDIQRTINESFSSKYELFGINVSPLNCTLYKGENNDEFYGSCLYKIAEESYCALNKIIYTVSTDNCELSDTFTASYDSDKTLYYAFESIANSTKQ